MVELWLTGRRRLALAFGLGAVAALGQAPLGFWWATLGALAGLIWLLQRMPDARSAFWAGLLAGAGYFGLALNWIIEPFMVDAAATGWMAPFAVVLLSFGLGLFWGGAAALARVSRNPILGFVAAFCGLEWLRGVIFTGFPWAMVGHVWIAAPMDQLAALGGPSLLSLVTVLAAALPVVWRWKGVAGSVALFALGMSFGLWRLGQPLPDPGALTLRLVQPNAEQAAKWEAERAQEFLNRLLTLTVKNGAADLTIWPETAVPYMLEYNPEVGDMIVAASGGRPVAVGIQREAAGRFYNSLRVLEGEGVERARYDKAHLVPFGEYIPFGDLAFDWFGLRAFAAQAGNTYSAGPGPQVLDLGRFGKVLPLICYEAIFPQDVNAMPERADWMLQITNDAWFGVWTGPFQHFAQARLRAVEQGLPLIRVANTGVTAVVDARGRVVDALPFGTMDALDARIPGALPPTPYARWGDSAFLLLLACLAGLSMITPRKASH
ncbi:MAG TPA: apolipoprotein N-acyltransferase [Tabrizicola sp.]|nr:apolipoprotein N-acyltransferase [Tabrizicola sp.]